MTSADVEPERVRASGTHGDGVVSVGLNNDGARKFCRLLRALEQRALQLDQRQPFVVAIDGRSRRIFVQPDTIYDGGSCGPPSFELAVGSLAEAIELARRIRGA